MADNSSWLIWQNRTDDSVIWVTPSEDRPHMAETCDCVGNHPSESEARQHAADLRDMFRDS